MRVVNQLILFSLSVTTLHVGVSTSPPASNQQNESPELVEETVLLHRGRQRSKVDTTTQAALKSSEMLEFEIGLTWDGKPIRHKSKVSLELRENDVELRISAPFYDDAPPPRGKPGKAFFKLWEYEVVEAFFLNDDDRYLELEFGPHGQHLMLLLDGKRNTVRHSLPMEYEASITKPRTNDSLGTWEGVAKIPLGYFPPNVTKFNAYAIHGPSEDRRYEALYEVSGPTPDFHHLTKFQPIDFSPTGQFGDAWRTALGDNVHIKSTPTTNTANSEFEFTIGLSWDGSEEVADPASLTLTKEAWGMVIKIDAQFYNDTAPPNATAGAAFYELWDYEVVEAFFLNDDDQYLELEFGPHGQYLMLLLDGKRNAIKHSLPLSYSSTISGDRWTALAHIPLQYFPPSVTKFNAYAIHGTGDNRTYEALYPVPGPEPDFHRIEKFESIDLSNLIPQNYNGHVSSIWQQAILESTY